MSILIKDIEMPAGNNELRLIIHSNGQVIISHKTCYEEAEAISVQSHGDLIDANKLTELCDIMADKCDDIGVSVWHQFKTTVEWSPIVISADESNIDTEEIVRCKDCKHWETSWTPRGVSDGRHYCAPLDLFPSADWFCADGEKRTETKQLSNVPVVIEAEEEA